MREDLKHMSNYLATRGLICHTWKRDDESKQKLVCYATGELITKHNLHYIEIIPTKHGYALHIAGDLDGWNKKSRIADYLETEFWNMGKEVRVDFKDEAQIYIESDTDSVLNAIDDIIRIIKGVI